MDGRIARKFLSALFCIFILVGCSSIEEPPSGSDPSNSSIEIEMTNEPLVTFHTPTGKTNVIVQFVARDEDGYVLGPDEVEVELLIDQAAIDNESILQDDSEELAANLYLDLVLDASYSMLQHSPSAFDPMLEAARDAIDQVDELYAGVPGTFAWDVAWFNETISEPSPSGRDWVSSDLLAIPEPGAGTATKLFAAAENEAHDMLEVYQDFANGPHDHHVMVIFSDGADNYSWFDNSSISDNGVTTSGAAYEVSGYGVADVDSAVTAIEAHPGLTVHVMGLGSDIQDDQLLALSEAGNGQFFKNPSSSEVDELFDLVTREFATIQNHGATIPLQPADYLFGLKVRRIDGGALDEITFNFHAGDENAGVLE
ncbi:MAG: VWA domain-containing protein [bacterium]|nr:VWA domain-containing protein [bacterium]